MNVTTKRRWSLLVVLILLLTAGIIGYQFVSKNYAIINGNFYRRDLESLNLSGNSLRNARRIAGIPTLKQADLRGTDLSVEDYEYLTEQLPDCEIQWDIPFQGAYYPVGTSELTVSSLTERDLKALQYLPNLDTVDASACQDFDSLIALQKMWPDCDVCFSVPVAGEVRDCHTTKLELQDMDIRELTQAVSYLPHVTAVHLMGKLPTAEELTQLQTDFPTIYFTCEVSGKKIPLGPNIRDVSFSGIPLKEQQAEELLAYFPKLEKVNFLNCGLSGDAMLRLADAHPDCAFVWEMELLGKTFRTDAEEIDISYTPMESTREIEDALPYFCNLKKVVMCECGFTCEEMDALNNRYEDIRFVWMVHLGNINLRTDATWFAPVAMGYTVSTNQLRDFRYCTDIICIDIGHQSVGTCEWAAYMPNLQYLIIADTSIEDITPLTGLTNLKFLEMFQTRVRDYSPLVTCTGLEDLNLCWTYGGSEPIAQMTWLHRLWWDGCYTSTVDLAEKLPDTECNFHSGSSTGGTWRLGQLYKNQRDIIGMPYMIG